MTTIRRHINNLLFSRKLSHDKALLEYNRKRPLGCDPTVCHIPYRSLYFGFDGIVTACCFNRSYVLGQFPNDSITEIINGNKRQQLQQALDHADFTLGCHTCLNQMLDGNGMSAGMRFGDTLPDNKTMPSEMVFELANTCNLRCQMCNPTYSSAIGSESQHPHNPYDGNEFISQLTPYLKHLSFAKFIGGEPFLIETYYKIWDIILDTNPKCKITVQTNGTILNDRIKTYLERGNFSFGISLDTLNSEHYSQIRIGATLDKTLDNIRYFSKIARQSGHNISIPVCPMKQNRFDIPELVDFCNKNDYLLVFNRVITPGFSLEELLPDELDKLSATYSQLTAGHHTGITAQNIATLRGLISYIQMAAERNRNLDGKVTMTKDDIIAIITDKLSSLGIQYDKSIFDEIPSEFSISRRKAEEIHGFKPHKLAAILTSNDNATISQMLKQYLSSPQT